MGALFPIQSPLVAQCSEKGLVQSPTVVMAERIKVLQGNPDSQFFESAAEAPQTASKDKQTAAPSGSSATSTLVSGASFSELLALAIDNGLISSQNGATTLNLNLFGFKALAKPTILDKQSEYQKGEFLRRWGGTLTFGGKGESFDRDGDGKADPALEAKDFEDIVVGELRYRFKGSRDRRDKMNVDRFFAETDSFAVFQTALNRVFDSHKDDFHPMIKGSCYDRKKVEEYLDRPEMKEELRTLAPTGQAAEDAIRKTNEAIDHSAVWTLVLGGTRRKQDFGPDKRMAAIRGSIRDFTVNLEWSRTDGLRGARDQALWKAAAEYSRLILQGNGLTEALRKDGAKLSGSASYDRNENVPTAKHPNIWKVNTKLEIPIVKGVKLPISVTWADHKDLLTDANEVVGHFALSIDFSELRKIGEKVTK